MAITRRRSNVPPPPKECSVTMCMQLLGGAWTPNIIWYLRSEPRRFSELMADIPGVSPKVFTARLKRLEQSGILIRRVMPTSPPTVEYSLTDLGQELTPAIEPLFRLATSSNGGVRSVCGNDGSSWDIRFLGSLIFGVVTYPCTLAILETSS